MKVKAMLFQAGPATWYSIFSGEFHSLNISLTILYKTLTIAIWTTARVRL
jgi:hypothetical protein